MYSKSNPDSTAIELNCSRTLLPAVAGLMVRVPLALDEYGPFAPPSSYTVPAQVVTVLAPKAGNV